MRNRIALAVVAAVVAVSAALVYAQNIVSQTSYSVVYDGKGRAMLVVSTTDPNLSTPPQVGAPLWRADENKWYKWTGSAWDDLINLGRISADSGVDAAAPTITDSGEIGDGETGISFLDDSIYFTLDGGNYLASIHPGSFRSEQPILLTPDATLTSTDSVGLRRATTDVLWITGDLGTEMGYVLSGQLITVNTGTATPASVADSGTCYSNEGDADGSVITLPNNPTKGTVICAGVVEAQTITITPNTNETLYLEGDQCLANLNSNTIGDEVVITAYTGGDGAIWIARGSFTCADV